MLAFLLNLLIHMSNIWIYVVVFLGLVLFCFEGRKRVSLGSEEIFERERERECVCVCVCVCVRARACLYMMVYVGVWMCAYIFVPVCV